MERRRRRAGDILRGRIRRTVDYVAVDIEVLFIVAFNLRNRTCQIIWGGGEVKPDQAATHPLVTVAHGELCGQKSKGDKPSM
jgi:hypothetical protein